MASSRLVPRRGRAVAPDRAQAMLPDARQMLLNLAAAYDARAGAGGAGEGALGGLRRLAQRIFVVPAAINEGAAERRRYRRFASLDKGPGMQRRPRH